MFKSRKTNGDGFAFGTVEVSLSMRYKGLFDFYFHLIQLRSIIFYTENTVFHYRGYYSPFEEIFGLLLAPTAEFLSNSSGLNILISTNQVLFRRAMKNLPHEVQTHLYFDGKCWIVTYRLVQ